VIGYWVWLEINVPPFAVVSYAKASLFSGSAAPVIQLACCISFPVNYNSRSLYEETRILELRLLLYAASL